MYPLLLNGVKLGTFEDEETGEEGFFAENDRGETFELGETVYDLLLIADGCHDFYAQGLSRRETADIIRYLKNYRLISTRRLQLGFPFGRLVLFVLGDHAACCKGPCTLFNKLLPYLCLLLCSAGLFSLRYAFNPHFLQIPYLFTLLIFLSTLILHEFGHFCACVAYDCRVMDVGILLLGILPVGAYVSQDEAHKRSQRLQIALAGLEMNFALAGLCALLARLPGESGQIFSAACLWNLVLGASNLLPAAEMDGEVALSILLGVPSFGDFAAEALRNPESRRMLLHGGAEGWFWLIIFLLQLLCRVLVFALFGVGIAVGMYLG